MTMGLVIGVDTGGTFTDFIALLPGGEVVTHKTLSTPDDPGRAVLSGLAELSERLLPLGAEIRRARLVHGSTVATNAVLERKGARTAFVTTEGFRDLLLIGRQNRRDLYDLAPPASVPLIPRELSFTVPERIDVEGRVVAPIEMEAVASLAGRLRSAGVESVAVVFLHSFTNPSHERIVAERLRAEGFPVSASHEILPEHREYERASTTALNAYVSPLMSRYLGRLNDRLRREHGVSGLRVMQSNGGVTDAADAGRFAVHTILSGPAGGVVGARRAALEAGVERIITFDMGGTSTDVSLVPGELLVTTESEIEGMPVRIPVLDIHTVGAGGGSIARIDPGGALRVGPESAGADPGPACYGRGGTAFTVTDADVVLGRLPGRWFMGGRMRIDREAAAESARRLAEAMGASVEEAALGVTEVVLSNMERAVKVISVERGFDPRDFCLVAFGGAGPLHASELARTLMIPRVLVPPYPGVLSAMGMAVADVVKTHVRAVMGRLDERTMEAARSAGRRLADWAAAALDGEGVPPESRRIQLSFDLRYARQSFELEIPSPGLEDGEPAELALRLADAFHRRHEEVYGHARRDQPVEIVAVRVRAEGRIASPRPRRLGRGKQRPEPVEVGTVRFATGSEETPIYAREALGAGDRIEGPAIVVEEHATTLLLPGDAALVLESGAILVTVGA